MRNENEAGYPAIILCSEQPYLGHYTLHPGRGQHHPLLVDGEELPLVVPCIEHGVLLLPQLLTTHSRDPCGGHCDREHRHTIPVIAGRHLPCHLATQDKPARDSYS